MLTDRQYITQLQQENATQKALLIQARESIVWILGGEPMDTLMLAAVKAIDAELGKPNVLNYSVLPRGTWHEPVIQLQQTKQTKN